MGRHDPIEMPTACMIRIKRNDKWFQMRPLCASVSHGKKVVERLRRMGRTVSVVWLSGMGI